MRTSVDVHNYLLERDVPHELVPVKGRLRSPELVAAVLGLPREAVGRVVLYEADERTVAALVPADRDPDPKLVAAALGAGEITELSPDRAADVTGFLHEAMPPAGLPNGIAVVMDPVLEEEEILYFPGGEATSVLKVRARDLARATGATVALITA